MNMSNPSVEFEQISRSNWDSVEEYPTKLRDVLLKLLSGSPLRISRLK